MYLDTYGSGGTNEYDWYVPVKYYMLTRFDMFSKNGLITGFQLTYNPSPIDSFTGWDEEVFFFGDSENAISLSLDFTQDLQNLQICAESDQAEIPDSNIKGFRFLEYHADDFIELSETCIGTWKEYDISTTRLIGFKVLT